MDTLKICLDGFLFAMILIFSIARFPIARAGTEGMPSMPMIVEKQTRTVGAKDDFDATKGFGDKAPMVRMMNLMMVEGSGMEGMKMTSTEGQTATAPATAPSATVAAPTASATSKYLAEAKSAVTPPRAGTTLIHVWVKDAKTAQPVKGLKLKAQVYMTSMDMGTQEPAVTESKSGTYEVKAPFAMKGPWAVKILFPDHQSQVFNFDVQSGAK
jgi:hypothetical protein